MHSLALKMGTTSVFIETPKHQGKMKTVGIGCRMRPEGPKIEPKAESGGGGSWGEGSKPPLQQLEGLGSAVSSHSGTWGGAPSAQRLSTIFMLRLKSGMQIV